MKGLDAKKTTIYASETKCTNERSYATIPKYTSGFHINFPWIYIGFCIYEPFIFE